MDWTPPSMRMKSWGPRRASRRDGAFDEADAGGPLGHHCAGKGEEGRVFLEGDEVGCAAFEEGGAVAGAAPTTRPRSPARTRRSWMRAGDDHRLHQGAAAGERERVIEVGAGGEACGDEAFARKAAHGGDDAGVDDFIGTHLAVDHVVAGGGVVRDRRLFGPEGGCVVHWGRYTCGEWGLPRVRVHLRVWGVCGLSGLGALGWGPPSPNPLSASGRGLSRTGWTGGRLAWISAGCAGGVRWQSGDAEDCKSLNAGSIPARTSSRLARPVYVWAGMRGRLARAAGMVGKRPRVWPLEQDQTSMALSARARPQLDHWLPGG